MSSSKENFGCCLRSRSTPVTSAQSVCACSRSRGGFQVSNPARATRSPSPEQSTKNFAAIASEDTVPFTDELEHSRAYLAVEQAQFEDTLFVSFDTPHTLFRVPPLTMQPLVENAVKHGMKSGRDPIHISVATRKTDKGSEIIVEDDGAGFDPVEDNEPHIALNNIRQRLEMMCKGTLEIKAREGGGTSVRVTIPEQK